MGVLKIWQYPNHRETGVPGGGNTSHQLGRELPGNQKQAAEDISEEGSNKNEGT